jgi:hypothetical protein
MKEIENRNEYHDRIDAIEQAFCKPQNKAAQRNPRETWEKRLQCLVPNWKPGHRHSTKHTYREARSHPGGERGCADYDIQHFCFFFPS